MVFVGSQCRFFFFVSGFFLGKRVGGPGWYGCALKIRLFSLGVPYLIWNLLAAALDFGIVSFSGLRHENGVPEVCLTFGSILSAFGLNVYGRMPPNFPLWFVRDLMIWIVISFVLGFLVRKGLWMKLFVGTMLVLNFALTLCESSCSWLIELVSLSGGLYFVIGFFASQRMFLWKTSLLQGVMLLSCGFAGFIVKAVFVFNNSEVLGRMIGWIAIPFALLGLWRLMPLLPVPNWMLGLAFPIYVLHYFVIRLMELGLGWFDMEITLKTSLVGYSLKGVVTCLISVLFAAWLVRMPLAKMVFGRRVLRFARLQNAVC